MTRAPHPAFRRLIAAGATPSRLHATLDRVERELRGVTFGLDRLHLLDHRPLEPLTRTMGVAEALTQARRGPASGSASVTSNAGNDGAERTVRQRRVDGASQEGNARAGDVAPTRRARMGDARASSASVRDGEARAAAHARHRTPQATDAPVSKSERSREHSPSSAFAKGHDSWLAHVDPAVRRDAEAVVARRLGNRLEAGADATASDAALSRRSQPRLELLRPRPHTFPSDNAPAPDTPLSSRRMASLPASDVGRTTPLRIGTVSPAVTAMLERAGPGRRASASTDDSAAHSELSSPGSPSPAFSDRRLDTLLERAAERASARVPGRGGRASLSAAPRERQAADAPAAQGGPESAIDAASGLRRLIARAGVTPLSAAHPPQAGIERAEGTLGVVADRMEENVLAQRLGRLLRREARRDGIDLDETGA